MDSKTKNLPVYLFSLVRKFLSTSSNINIKVIIHNSHFLYNYNITLNTIILILFYII